MAKITAIKKQEKRDRVNIYIDDVYGFSLSLEEYLKAHLSRGQEIIPDKIESVLKQDKKKKLMDLALKYLTYRPRSESEVRTHLKQKLSEQKYRQKKQETSEPEDVTDLITEVIERLKTIGQIDDLNFAEWWIGQRMEFRPKARRIIEQELLSKGIKRETVEEALLHTGTKNEETELKNAQRVIQKKMNSFSKLPENQRKLKIESYLARQGYSWDIIKKVIKTPTHDDEL